MTHSRSEVLRRLAAGPMEAHRSPEMRLLVTRYENTAYFRRRLTDEGFDDLPGDHPIVPIMIGDGVRAGPLAERMLAKGVYVIAFSFPVVPNGKARIRTQVSAAHSRADLDRALAAFVEARDELG